MSPYTPSNRNSTSTNTPTIRRIRNEGVGGPSRGHRRTPLSPIADNSSFPQTTQLLTITKAQRKALFKPTESLNNSIPIPPITPPTTDLISQRWRAETPPMQPMRVTPIQAVTPIDKDGSTTEDNKMEEQTPDDFTRLSEYNLNAVSERPPPRTPIQVLNITEDSSQPPLPPTQEQWAPTQGQTPSPQAPIPSSPPPQPPQAPPPANQIPKEPPPTYTESQQQQREASYILNLEIKYKTWSV